MLRLHRTDSTHADFRMLVGHLDRYLAGMNGDQHDFYDQFNKIDHIQHAIVAYQDEMAVGCGAIKAFDDQRMEVKRMFVLTEHRGNGIASTMLRALEAWAAELGYEGCVLETGIHHADAIALYEKSGYQRIPNYGQYAGVENSVCFEKKLR